jgi:hypothetical protein
MASHFLPPGLFAQRFEHLLQTLHTASGVSEVIVKSLSQLIHRS